LQQWSQCAWLDYREACWWTETHPARQYGLPLYAADAEGIRTALKRFLSEQGVVTANKTVDAPPVYGEVIELKKLLKKRNINKL